MPIILGKRAAQPKAQKGFSYLWILLLLGLMGVSLMAAVEIDTIITQRDNERELLAQGRQFRSAIKRYYTSQQSFGERKYPASLDNLLKDDRFPGVKRHLRRIFVDPMTKTAEWGLLKIDGRIVGVHSLSKKRPLKQGGFDFDEESFREKRKYSEWIFSYPSNLLLHTVDADSLTLSSTLEKRAQDASP